jgi:A/G-specific adenine glycosylase
VFLARKLTRKLPAKGIPAFQRRLLGWYRRRKRDLPWRRTRDPYRIWLAEIMLQQTRVAAVVPYYRRFLRRFPTLGALAGARSEQVLRLWAGLGYYSRARHLHRAAKEIVARHGGRFPRELEAALRLPGIGRYTAAAVLSMAYGLPEAVLDGNVARVLARLGGLRGDLRAPRRWKHLQSAAQELLEPAAAGDWNQAMMELGATVCTPRSPRCGACPVSRWCRAYKLGIAEQLPSARRKRAPVKLSLAAAVLLDRQGRTLVLKPDDCDSTKEDAALFSRMWQFPAVRVSNHAERELRRHLRASLGLEGTELVELGAARHSVTYREITLAPFLLRVERLPRLPGARTPLLAALDRLPVSSATRKIAAAALQELPRI